MQTDDTLFLSVIFALLLIVMISMIFVPNIKSILYKKECLRYVKREYENNWEYYHNLLSKYNQYYCNLSGDDKRHFICRLLHFKYTKTFEYIGIDSSPEIPVLISAAAVQLTFGLNHYLLDFFKHIYVIKSEYYYGISNAPYQGHINKSGIFFSWKNFLEDFQVYDDAQNVGLHEMAHALAYTNFVAGEDIDNDFIARFKRFSLVARPIFNQLQVEDSSILDHYAATNYNEFWAVCIETYFERPLQLQQHLPQLYDSICKLLNQNPLQAPEVLIKPILFEEDKV